MKKLFLHALLILMMVSAWNCEGGKKRHKARLGVRLIRRILRKIQ